MHTTISMAFLDTEPREHRLDQQTHQQDDNGVEIYFGCQGWPDMNLLSELGGTFNYIQHRWHCIYRASHWLAISVISLLTMLVCGWVCSARTITSCCLSDQHPPIFVSMHTKNLPSSLYCMYKQYKNLVLLRTKKIAGVFDCEINSAQIDANENSDLFEEWYFKMLPWPRRYDPAATSAFQRLYLYFISSDIRE